MKIWFSIFLLVIGPTLFAQQWTSIITSNANDQNEGTTTKVYQNKVYFAGRYKGTLNIGFNSCVGIANNDIFVGKANTTGFTEWLLPINGTGIDKVSKIDVVGDEIMVSGQFSDSLFVGDDTLINPFQNGCFIAYFDTLGNYLRVWSPDAFNCDIKDFKYDSQGKLLMTGEFFQHFTYGGFTMTINSGLNFFLLKYDPVQDSILWGVYSQGNANYGKQLDLDAQDNAYITGGYSDGTYFIDTLINTGNLNHNMYLVKVDQDGNRDYFVAFEGTGEVHGYGVAVDDSSNAFVLGEFEGIMDVQGELYTSNGYYDAIIAKFDPNGNRVWSESIGGPGSDEGYDLLLDSNQDPIIMMDAEIDPEYQGQILYTHGFNEPLILKIKNSDAALIWDQRLYSTQSTGVVNTSAISMEGNLIALTGINRTSIEFNSNIYNALNNKDFYVTILTDSLTYHLDIQETNSPTSLVKLFPNPFTENFNLELLQKPDFLIFFDLKGNPINKIFVNSQNITVNTTDFNPGFYYIQVWFGDKFETYKLLKID